MAEHADISEKLPADKSGCANGCEAPFGVRYSICNTENRAADNASTGEDERCECDSHTGVGIDLWRCDECGEVIRYVDDPNGKVALTTLHPYNNRRVRVEMVTPGTRPGNRGWWS